MLRAQSCLVATGWDPQNNPCDESTFKNTHPPFFYLKKTKQHTDLYKKQSFLPAGKANGGNVASPRMGGKGSKNIQSGGDKYKVSFHINFVM